MGTSARQDDPMLRLQYYRETGQADEAKQYEQYLRETGQYRDPASSTSGVPRGTAIPVVRPDATAALPRNRRDATGDLQAATRNIGDQTGFIGRGIAANVLNAAQGIPGMEAFEAASGAIGSRFTDHPMSYKESLAALRGETNAIPAPIQFGEKIAGAAPLAAALPAVKSIGGAAKLGGGLAGADVLFSADPNRSLADRAIEAPIAALVGAGLGAGTYGAAKVIDKGRTLLSDLDRVRKAPTMGAQEVEREAEIKATDKVNYGAAKTEGENNQTSPALQKALDLPIAQPFVTRLRASVKFGKADDATIAREAYKLMSKQESSILQKIANKGEYDAALELDASDLRSAKQALLEATGATSENPPLYLDVAPEVFETAPKITPGRDALSGPVLEGTAGRARGMSSQVAIDPNGRTTAVSPRDVQGPAGPAFQLAAQPERVTPGVEIETPGMRVQTAPAEAVPPVMPSFGKAVEGHRELAQARSLYREGADKAKTLMAAASKRAAKSATDSPEAIEAWVKSLTPEQAREALMGALARGKEGVGFRLPGTQHTLVGAAGSLFRPGVKLSRLSPFIRQLDLQAGNDVRLPLNIEAIMRLLAPLNATTQP